MNVPIYALKSASLVLLAPAVLAHEGHGVPGTLGHDLQHQLWSFAAFVVLGALLLAGDRMLAFLRVVVRNRQGRKDDDARR